MQQLFQSAFLQALGKAIANSIWQIGLLYLLYHVVVFLFRIKQSTVKNFFSTVLSFTGFAWFLYTIGNLWGNQLLQKTSLVITDAGKHNSLLNSFANDNRWELFFNWLDYKIQFVLPYLSAAYLFVLLWFAAKLIIQVQAANALRNKGLTKVEDEVKEFFSYLVETMGLQRNVQLYFSKQIDIPATIGFLKPIVLLPATAVTHLTAAQLEAVLLHELAHIKRNDYFWNMLLSVSETMLFFNPFALLLIGIARRERENSCDDYVMNYQQNAAVYAEALLNVEKARIQNPQLAMALGDNKHHLKDRIKRILNLPAEKNKISSRLLALVLFTVVFALTGWMLKEHKPVVQLSERRTASSAPSKQTANTTYYLTTEVVEKKTKDEVVLHDEERKYRLQLHPKTKMEKIVLWDEVENEELKFDKVIINDMPVEWFERIVKPGTQQRVQKPENPERNDVFLFRYKHDSLQYAQQEREMNVYLENADRTREAPRRKNMQPARVTPGHYLGYSKTWNTDSLLNKINIQWPEEFTFHQFVPGEFFQRFPMEEGYNLQRTIQQGSDAVKKERMKAKVNVMRRLKKDVDSTTLAEEKHRFSTNRSGALALLYNQKALMDEVKRAQQHFEIVVENDVMFIQGPPPCTCPVDSLPQPGQQVRVQQPKRVVIKKLEVIRL
ncbi:M56 family metallopeptidase [Lacibacter luteus]|uniref:M56 family metallopeptidase n=1 Tax=Lacibacter luteus TaxID=2508719 RepID=A0A4Q1CFZ5_9BACT|nr:M56 family metallopeptidase [Lacibacter luteus]RXK58936.1 M56 family metallopeptidase [Lacibacter luteus]